jgi:enoyl-CoA hydratase/carnithine racemase
VTLLIDDENRVRTLTLNRPEALNAFNEALYDATTQALLDAAEDPEVAVVLLTGAGRGFSAGTDLAEMQARITDPQFQEGKYGFRGLIEALSAFPKPLICAINGVGLGIGTTILGYADLAFMSSAARLKCPFTSLGVAPEAASSYLLPQLVGRQNARRYADILAGRPISSLMAVKHTMLEPLRPEIAAATARENAHFAELMGAQANAAALADFSNRPR